jgi:hypothetical protein
MVALFESQGEAPVRDREQASAPFSVGGERGNNVEPRNRVAPHHPSSASKVNSPRFVSSETDRVREITEKLIVINFKHSSAALTAGSIGAVISQIGSPDDVIPDNHATACHAVKHGSGIKMVEGAVFYEDRLIGSKVRIVRPRIIAPVTYALPTAMPRIKTTGEMVRIEIAMVDNA